MADTKTHSVRMPDGTIIQNVPEGITQEELLNRYSLLKVRTAKTKYELPEEESYSPEGIPLYQPSYQADKSKGIQTAEDILTDIAKMPVRAAMSVAKPITGALEFTGLRSPTEKPKSLSDLVAPQEKFGQINTPSQAVQAIDTGLKGPWWSGSTAASLVGDIASGFGGAGAAQKALQFAPKAAAAFGRLNPYAKTAIGGAGFGLTMPTGKTVGEEGFAKEKAGEAALGAGLGLGLHGAGSKLAGFLSPQLERLKKLRSQGIDTTEFEKNATPGQLLGGFLNIYERGLEAAPFGGMKGFRRKGEETLKDLERQRLNEMRAEVDANKLAVDTRAKALESKVQKTKEAKNLAFQEQKLRQNKALKEQKDTELSGLSAEASVEKQALADRHAAEMAELEAKHGEFSTPIIAKVLEPIERLGLVKDVALPAEARGHEAIKHAQKKVSEAYDTAIKNLGNVYTQPKIYEQIVGILEKAKSPSSGIGEAEAERISKYITSKFLEPLENMEGLTGERWHQLFKELGDAAYNQKNWQEASVYKQIQQAWGDLAAEGNPTIKTINEAFKILQPVERAAVKSGASEAAGEFGPKELLSSAISEAPSRSVAARGEAILQPEARTSLAAMKAEKAALEAKQAAERKAFEDQQNTIKAQNDARAAVVRSQYEDQKIANQLAQAQEQNRLNALAKDRQDRIEAARKSQENRLSAEHDIQKEGLKETVNEVITKPTSALETGVYRSAMVSPIVYKAGRSLLDPSIDAIPSAINFMIGEGAGATGLTLAAPALARFHGHVVGPLIKAGALAERPSIIKKAGENVREYLKSGIGAPAASTIPTYEGYQEQKTENEEYAYGGLVHLASGGHATAAWQRKEGQNPEGGLNAAGRASYHAETGGTLKPPVSAKEAKSSPKKAARRKSFCARMTGMEGPMKDESGKPTRKALALRKWDC